MLLKHSLVLTVSKRTGRAYIHDGNHRMAVLNDLKVEWVPVKIWYFYINDDYEPGFHFVPKLFEDCPDYPTPELLGFTTLNLDPIFRILLMTLIRNCETVFTFTSFC